MYFIGVAGGSGSGKTTFAKKIIKGLNKDLFHLIHMDSYYLDIIPKELSACGTKNNFDHPDAFDWELLKSDLKKLKEKCAIESPEYDFITSRRTKIKNLMLPKPIIIIEGLFPLYSSTIRDLLDIKIFLNVEADIRFARRLVRDIKERGRSMESVVSQYYDSVRPMYKEFLEPQKQYADIIVGEETDKASEIIASNIRDKLILMNIQNKELFNQTEHSESNPDFNLTKEQKNLFFGEKTLESTFMNQNIINHD